MAKPIPEENLKLIEAVVAKFDNGASALQISDALVTRGSLRTLQYRLRLLVKSGRLQMQGDGRATRYRLAPPTVPKRDGSSIVQLSPRAKAVLAYVNQPISARRPVGYRRAFLDQYRPNETFYLSLTERNHLASLRTPQKETAAGTYAKQILNRLLIDLAWNSSRLEGNTYTLLDTRRLLAFGQAAEGHGQLEAQMILNHKDAIEFLITSISELGFNRYTILNLHALLANNLLADPCHFSPQSGHSVFAVIRPQMLSESKYLGC
jgi:hypothetical protein